MKHNAVIGDIMPINRNESGLDSHLVPSQADISKPSTGKTRDKIRGCVANLSQNAGAEIVRYGRSKTGVLSLGQGEGSMATPDFIMQGARKAMEDGRTFYGPVLGQDALRQEIANYYDRIYNIALPTSRIFVTSSGTTAMHIALTAILDEGDEVVAVTPIWKNLLSAVELAQAKFTEVALDHGEEGWTLDLDKLFEACGKETRAILITSPSNPTGWVMPREQIRAVMEFARARDIWIIADEVYGRLVYGKSHAPSFLEFAHEDDRLFTVNSFSKAWAMTGWRLGWLTGPARVEPAVQDIALYDNMGAPSFTQYGAIEALRHGEDFIAAQMALWARNRGRVQDFFAGTQGRIVAAPSEATFYSFFTVEGEDDCMALARRLIDEAGLSLAPGCAFGQVGKGYMRLCYAVAEDRLEDALGRLARGLGLSL